MSRPARRRADGQESGVPAGNGARGAAEGRGRTAQSPPAPGVSGAPVPPPRPSLARPARPPRPRFSRRAFPAPFPASGARLCRPPAPGGHGEDPRRGGRDTADRQAGRGRAAARRALPALRARGRRRRVPAGAGARAVRAAAGRAQIFGFSNNYWELRRCRPKLKKLKKLLMENTYEGPDSEKEKDSSHSKYTTEDLLDQIQASEEEIMTQLQVLNACEIGGYWRILEFDYEMKLLNHITQLVDSESWSFSKVPLNTCLQELGPLEPEEMIEHCLKCYGKKYTEEGAVYFELSADKICRATAQMLLQNAVKFNLAEFQEVWQQSVPEGMTTRLDQLKGLALVDRQSRPEIIFLLKAEDLPEGDQERFNSLFSLREKWTEEDIAPYIQDLCGEKQTIGALLTKYARSSMQNGVKVYNSRRPIS
uniref:Sister chromatid cohesion protein DCC1 n=1 Tax=Bos taurus TaxID=9913 RepID=F1MTU0_BOVIN